MLDITYRLVCLKRERDFFLFRVYINRPFIHFFIIIDKSSKYWEVKGKIGIMTINDFIPQRSAKCTKELLRL